MVDNDGVIHSPLVPSPFTPIPDLHFPLPIPVTTSSTKPPYATVMVPMLGCAPPATVSLSPHWASLQRAWIFQSGSRRIPPPPSSATLFMCSLLPDLFPSASLRGPRCRQGESTSVAPLHRTSGQHSWGRGRYDGATSQAQLRPSPAYRPPSLSSMSFSPLEEMDGEKRGREIERERVGRREERRNCRCLCRARPSL